MNQKTITLSTESQIIGQGVFCTCFLHPHDDAILIKLPTDHKKARKRQRVDTTYYNKLHRQEIELTHVADYLGTCDTNRGGGHLYEHVVDHDGSTSKTLDFYLKNQPETAEKIIEHLFRLRRYLSDNLILIGDLHGNNILFQHLNESEHKLMIVDGLGDRVTVTALNIFKQVKTGKITRRWNRFMKRLQRNHPSITFPMEKLNLP